MESVSDYQFIATAFPDLPKPADFPRKLLQIIQLPLNLWGSFICREKVLGPMILKDQGRGRGATADPSARTKVLGRDDKEE